MRFASSRNARAMFAVVLLAAGASLAACSSKEKSKVINSGPDGITIQYDSRYSTMAGVDADEHCAKFGKRAVRVETKAPSTADKITEPYAAQGVFACEAGK
jgi:hypothetical protein